MKSLSKYKIYIKSNKILDNFPQRIKQFHRTKWKKFLIKNRFKTRRYKFKNFLFRTFSKGKRKFIRMRKYYKESLIVKNNLLQSFDNSYKFSVLKKDLLRSKNLKYINFLNLMLIKQNYFINILLWRLHFFSSTNEASYFINNNFVFVNGKLVKSNYFLNSGDIITFKDSFFFNFKKNLRTYKMFKSLRSFVEIDYYTCSLIVIKDFNNFTLDDFSSFLSSSINISSVYNNIR